MANNQTQALQFSGLLPEIQEFLEKLIKDAGLSKADPVLKTMMLDDLSARLDKQLFFAFAKALSEQEMENFMRLAGVDQAQALAYLKDIKPEMPQVVLEALAEFRTIFLEEEKSK